MASRRNQELGELSRGPYEARRNAFKRVEAEALRLGAAGVVGVRYEVELTFGKAVPALRALEAARLPAKDI